MVAQDERQAGANDAHDDHIVDLLLLIENKPEVSRLSHLNPNLNSLKLEIKLKRDIDLINSPTSRCTWSR